MTLREIIAAEIQECGPIPFSRYMELCLYHRELGYYSRNAEQFGKAGDFYTSSDVHAVFGRLLARQFDQMWHALGAPEEIEILELGPGRGLFARDVLDWSEKKFPEFFRAVRYRLVESSAALRVKLQESLSRHIAGGKASLLEFPEVAAAKAAPAGARMGTAKVVSSRLENDRAKEAAFSHGDARDGIPSGVPGGGKNDAGLANGSIVGRDAIVFANEFFDALPVEVVSDCGELRVDAHDGIFVETWAPPSPQELEYLDRYSVQPEAGERVEALLVAQHYMQRIASAVQRGFIIAIDYGYTRDELLAGRHRDTVMAYRRHSASPNPYEAPGEQDITAHVNFTALASAVEQNGMQAHRLLTQSQFLMGIGEQTQFGDAFEECRLPQERAKVALQLKHLVTPAGMGETFHALVANKGVEPDVAARLSGLAFGNIL